MGNVRGNYYTRNHTQLVQHVCKNVSEWQGWLTWKTVEHCEWVITDPEKFWGFSFDEMGKYDLPAMLERIKKVTGRKKVNYVGHSQGSVVLFSAVAQLGHEFSRKINKLFALAPAASVSKMNTTFKTYMNETHYVYEYLEVSFGLSILYICFGCML